jgi:hypothetical protein
MLYVLGFHSCSFENNKATKALFLCIDINNPIIHRVTEHFRIRYIFLIHRTTIKE